MPPTVRFALTSDGRAYPVRRRMDGLWEIGRPAGKRAVLVCAVEGGWRCFEVEGETSSQSLLDALAALEPLDLGWVEATARTIAAAGLTDQE